MLKKLVIHDKVETDVRVDPRIKRTRHLLQKAFESLLEKKGFPNITVNDIAVEADVNRATFYLHFEDKYALLRYSLRESFADMLEQRLGDERTFSLNNLQLLTVTLCEFINKFYGHCHPEAGSEEIFMLHAHLQQNLYELLLSWIINSDHSPICATPRKTQGEPAIQQPSADYTAAALSWLVFGTAIQAQTTSIKQPPEQWAQHMLALVTPGLLKAL